MRNPRTSAATSRPTSRAGRAWRAVHHAVFHESREGRAAEVVAWANGASALLVGAATAASSWGRLGLHALTLAAAASLVVFAVLRLLLAHRVTVWVAAALGTLTIAALGGSLAWVLAHVIEDPSAPSIAAVVGALIAAAPPAWSYARLAQRRREDVPDSLLAPVSAPHSY